MPALTNQSHVNNRPNTYSTFFAPKFPYPMHGPGITALGMRVPNRLILTSLATEVTTIRACRWRIDWSPMGLSRSFPDTNVSIASVNICATVGPTPTRVRVDRHRRRLLLKSEIPHGAFQRCA